MIVFAADYVEFTNSSIYALDSCRLDNHGTIGIDNEAASFPDEVSKLQPRNDLFYSYKWKNCALLVLSWAVYMSYTVLKPLWILTI
jgi:hypothetical protein